jgi:hypothetical protein
MVFDITVALLDTAVQWQPQTQNDGHHCAGTITGPLCGLLIFSRIGSRIAESKIKQSYGPCVKWSIGHLMNPMRFGESNRVCSSHDREDALCLA